MNYITNNIIIENLKLYKINDNTIYNNVDDDINKIDRNFLNKFRKRNDDKKINLLKIINSE